MSFDSGEVLQGLSEEWSFLGANMMEWAAGLVVFITISLFANSPARAMPFMLAGWVTTTVSLATIRHMYPDQERGVRNALLTYCGFPPPGIPAPAKIQPIWSGAPVREVPQQSKFVKAKLDQMFPSFERDTKSADEG